MPWLEKQRPELMPLYEKLYPRAYAPKEQQKKLSRLVSRFVRQYGGRAVEPTQIRDEAEVEKQPPRKRSKAAAPRQLDLEL